ncbi:hypothetical protein [Chondrinema litorale]|uniref:hypothetical protein n=1 Tax=Chondrinema litorale TaxID=2994555 RepID=UPI0025438B5C|nr:hypothetical protein [Chondrinema litorale]UZR97776.1 hypothetical protein OQ292_27600 [Chondrinema litorale]
MNVRKYLLLIIGIILVLSLIIYPLYFGICQNYNLSKKPDDWATFATFESLLISIISLLVTSYLTYLIYKSNEFNSKNQKAFQQAINKPILSLHNNGNGYSLQNIGNGAALNVKVFIKMKYDDGSEFLKKFKTEFSKYANHQNDGYLNNWKRRNDVPEISNSHKIFEKLSNKSIEYATEEIIINLGIDPKKFDLSIIVYSIKGNSEPIKLPHTIPAVKICVYFDDIFKNKYILNMENDEEQIDDLKHGQNRKEILTLINYRI